ncbi:MAG: ATPase [Candidatus Omnitrophica bacterium CG11_big_fil_rev_8_21_14_0_20_45_26]|uniref:ATPase n=1 Tax=Candidatus Abzuiibacterium crystallinum TaxID=1974748 RepID=A0A2H0LS61_9BACT|nr:MAG: ATPase [Candidatus Omnitrophica bacterium CG11_big_fil_rev_8_21_14_0_20_45_26]PIW65012.1 MAG: ATPase [Candidatus Omnitrophica bacterium CG12_big_fil_rev_8_21_14_0_65_45_16]
MQASIRELGDKIKSEHTKLETLFQEINKVMVGQKYLIERLMIGLLGNGHILIEGVPGLAKTTAVRTLANAIRTDFQRIQFTPDLLPADLIGTLVYNPKDGHFTTKKGPIFSHIILADEINRAPSKVQSALLEAMQERQVTIGDTTFKLDDPFLVLATQNPIEQEGTYPLPEAQVDRFMLKLSVTYPTRKEEKEILERMSTGTEIQVQPVMEAKHILDLRKLVNQIYVDEKIKDYILDIVFATRNPENYKLDSLKPLINFGASPRASIMLTVAAKAQAFLKGRGYVTPEDVKQIGMDVLRHRVIVTYEAEAEEMRSEDIVGKIFDQIEVP